MSLLGDEAQAIVDAGREVDGPSDEDRARIKRKLMARVGGGMAAAAAIAAAGAASAPASAAAATSAMSATSATGAMSTTSAAGAAGTGAAATAAAVGSGGALAKVGAIVALVGVLGGGAALGLREPARPARLAANAAAIEEAAARAQEAAAAREVKEAEPAAAPAREAAAPAPVSQQPARRLVAESAKPGKAGNDLGAELEALKKAQGALREGDGDRALSALDDAKGDALREERMAARVFALCQLGRVEEARAAAAQFLREAPRSPLAGRVRAACADGAPAAAP